MGDGGCQPMMGVNRVEHEVAHRYRHRRTGKAGDHHVKPGKGARYPFTGQKCPQEGEEGRMALPITSVLHVLPLSFTARLSRQAHCLRVYPLSRRPFTLKHRVLGLSRRPCLDT